eukprot:TRINITY_DN838_c0_g1_i1.p2 TRINITY_DN838_c0_g1~~TRINITY_DN838_c0_g1_i1.p2  ORF type:complete len:155 (-),score=56.86 TRINITY_DN838_c0_g1_i1:111-575(-)
MYKKLAAFLLIFLSISLLFYLLESSFVVMERRDQLWGIWWIWDGYWEIGYFFVVLLIAVLWRPNEHNQRYAYSVQISQSEDNNIEIPNQREFGLDSDDEGEIELNDKASDSKSGGGDDDDKVVVGGGVKLDSSQSKEQQEKLESDNDDDDDDIL